MSKFIYTDIITQDNIQDYTERMAVCATRGLARIMGKYQVHKLYASLIKDIKHKNDIGYIIFDGYDVVQEAICFLYEHLGKRLDDRTCKAITGK